MALLTLICAPGTVVSYVEVLGCHGLMATEDAFSRLPYRFHIDPLTRCRNAHSPGYTSRASPRVTNHMHPMATTMNAGPT